jgi:hypothetical protein
VDRGRPHRHESREQGWRVRSRRRCNAIRTPPISTSSAAAAARLCAHARQALRSPRPGSCARRRPSRPSRRGRARVDAAARVCASLLEGLLLGLASRFQRFVERRRALQHFLQVRRRAQRVWSVHVRVSPCSRRPSPLNAVAEALALFERRRSFVVRRRGVLLPPRCGIETVATPPCTHTVTLRSLNNRRRKAAGRGGKHGGVLPRWL